MISVCESVECILIVSGSKGWHHRFIRQSVQLNSIVTKEVTLQLIKSKCLPVPIYGLEACPLTKSGSQFLDFVINRFFMKLFTTKSIETVK